MPLIDPFPQLPFNSLEDFARRLELSAKLLRDLSRESGERYRRDRQQKRDGGYRTIDEPDVILKAVQEFVLRRVFDQIKPSPIAYAVKGRGHVAAARRHVRWKWVACDDISDFFPSITTEVARELFSQMGSDPELAEMLAGLLTFRGSLPQGAPTSSTVANFLLAAVDHRVGQAAQENKGRATRYVDDFVYSGPDDAAIEAVREVAEKEIRSLGFNFNPKKKRTMPRNRPQCVYGLSVNNRLSVPKRKPAEDGGLTRNKLKSDVHRAAKHGCPEKHRETLLGQIRFVSQFHPQLARKLEKQLRSAP